MSTVNELILRQPVAFQKRFAQEQRWVDWTNDLLEELSGEGILPEIEFERGVEVKREYWITKPPNLRRIKRIYNPQNSTIEYRWEDVEGKIRLELAFDDQETVPAITEFTNYDYLSVDVNLDGYDKDEFAGHLLVIDTGTYAARTYVLFGNDASSTGTTRIYFVHDLTSNFDALKTITGRILSDEHFLMMRYSGEYDPVTLGTDEVPIEAKYERRVTEAWFRWKCERASTRVPDDALPFYQAYRDIVEQIKAEIKSNIGGPVAARRLAGFM